MKKYFYLSFFTIAIFFSGLFIYKKIKPYAHQFKKIDDKLMIRENENVSGIFYKENSNYIDSNKNFTHLVLQVNNESSFEVSKDIINNIPKNQSILLTVELWGSKYYLKSNSNPLKEITDGKLDDKLQKIYDLLLANNNNIYVRINPEMDLWTYNYPWQNNTNKYIEAYRHVVLKWKNKNPNLKFVWGPTGFMGVEEFYPGDDVVDFMSITLQSKFEKLYTRYPYYPNIKTEIHRKFHRLRFFNKPLFLISNGMNNKIKESVVSQIDTINKYQDIAYNDSLWKNSDTINPDKKFDIGLYDPHKLLLNDPNISIEHVFVDFGQIQSGHAKKIIDEVFLRNHNLILTVEPWKDLSNEKDPNILINISKGKYDSIIHRIFEDVANTEHIVYLRFAHEMEIPINRYTWQSKDPINYIKAYRHFMQLPNQFPQNVKKIWGPAGDRGSVDFYPGDDVVDYMSFAIYGLPDKNITDYQKQQTFAQIFNKKTWSLRLINKPIFITEFGVKGPEDFQTMWLEGAAKTLNKNHQVVGVNYFNMSDTPGAWGKIKEPDWSIRPKTLQHFLKVKKEENLWLVKN